MKTITRWWFVLSVLVGAFTAVAEAEEPSDLAAAAWTVIDGVRHNYAALDDLVGAIADVTQRVEVVVRANETLSTTYALMSSNVTIRSEGTVPCVVTVASSAGFVVTNGMSLTVSNITFKGVAPTDYVQACRFIKIDGGAVTLAAGTTLEGIVGRVDNASGVLDVLGGSLTIKDGAVVRNCKAQGLGNGAGRGGAVYVRGAGCQVILDGGVISNCYAAKYGGGLYLNNYNGCAGVSLSGAVRVVGNSSANFTNDDIYVASHDACGGLKVVGTIDGCVGVRYSSTADREGEAFIVNALSTAPDDTTLYSFFSDATTGFVAAVGTEGQAGYLVWAKDTRDPYQIKFGTDQPFVNPPTVEITHLSGVEGGLQVTVLVKDGDEAVGVDAELVKAFFEATSDLNDWSKKVDVAVTLVSSNDDKSVTYTVTPTPSTSAAFIRLIY